MCGLECCSGMIIYLNVPSGRWEINQKDKYYVFVLQKYREFTSFVKAAAAYLQEKRSKHINQSWLDLDLTLKWHMHAGEQHHHRFLRSAPFYAWAYLCGFRNENSYLRLDTFCCWQSECELLDLLWQHERDETTKPLCFTSWSTAGHFCLRLRCWSTSTSWELQEKLDFAPAAMSEMTEGSKKLRIVSVRLVRLTVLCRMKEGRRWSVNSDRTWWYKYLLFLAATSF